jgi:predicted Ser/Thr protein kinase
MTPDDHELVILLFNRSLEIDAAERGNFLDANCSDEEIRSEVDSLLDSHLSAGSFLERSHAPGLGSNSYDRGESDRLIGIAINERYQIESVLGSGGQGVAYLARDRSVGNRLVVVKMLSEALPDSTMMGAALRREMEILAELNHPGVVGVIDAGEWQGRPYLTIEYVEGETLRQLLTNGVDRSTAASLVRQIGSAMAAVHARGIAHRDLKPENVLVASSDGRVRLIDFGIARRPRSETVSGTTTVFVAGTLNYMAPEQFLSEHSLSADIYALGVITHEMLTGRLPFSDDDVSLRFSRNPRLRFAARDEVTGTVARLLRKSLSSDPSMRPSSIGEMSEQLAREIEPGRRRHKQAIVAAGTFLLLFAIAMSVYLFRDKPGWRGATYERVVEVESGFDPTQYGFKEMNQITGQVVFKPDNSGYEGIRESTSSQGFLVRPFTVNQQLAAMKNGWILSGRIRAEQGGALLIADFDRMNRRYDIFVFRNPKGGTGVRLIDKLMPSLMGREITVPDSQPTFHDLKMQFDPRTTTASLAMDGQVVLSGYKGHSEYVNPYGLVLGVSKYLSERGIATFSGARFEILH